MHGHVQCLFQTGRNNSLLSADWGHEIISQNELTVHPHSDLPEKAGLQNRCFAAATGRCIVVGEGEGGYWARFGLLRKRMARPVGKGVFRPYAGVCSVAEMRRYPGCMHRVAERVAGGGVAERLDRARSVGYKGV